MLIYIVNQLKKADSQLCCLLVQLGGYLSCPFPIISAEEIELIHSMNPMGKHSTYKGFYQGYTANGFLASLCHFPRLADTHSCKSVFSVFKKWTEFSPQPPFL